MDHWHLKGVIENFYSGDLDKICGTPGKLSWNPVVLQYTVWKSLLF